MGLRCGAKVSSLAMTVSTSSMTALTAFVFASVCFRKSVAEVVVMIRILGCLNVANEKPIPNFDGWGIWG